MTGVTDTFNVLTPEKARGGVASIISGCLANLLNVVLILVGLDPAISTIVSLQCVGNLLTYFLDIMIAKHKFHGKAIAYTDFAYRFSWFVTSFMGPPFHKFIVACIIEGVFIYVALLRARKFCDRRNIKFPLRDALLAALIAAASFILVMNVLRFNWVLEENESIVLNISIIAWMATSVLLILLIPQRSVESNDV